MIRAPLAHRSIGPRGAAQRASAALLAVSALLMPGAAGCRSTPPAPAPAAVENEAATPRVTPFLMFQDGRSEEAIDRYVGIFRDARIVSIERYGPGGPGAEGSIQLAAIEIHGQRILVTESPIRHPFGFTPAISLFVDLDSPEEFERVFAALSQEGFVMMPPDDYGFSRRFAFIQDRYGVSWQINLPSQ